MTSNATITPAEACEYLREMGLQGSPQWQTALYWRGILTQSEYFANMGGELTDEEVLANIDSLKAQVEAWLLA